MLIDGGYTQNVLIVCMNEFLAYYGSKQYGS
jgi:hypothetical protein